MKSEIDKQERSTSNKRTIVIGIVIIAACIAIFAVALFKFIIPKYNSAVSLEKGKNNKSVTETDASKKKDNKNLIEDYYKKTRAEEIQDEFENIEVGDTYTFGAYEQNDDTSDGKEDIEWIVLAKENGKALVISKYALDCQKYNSAYTDVTWESCSLRKWMNSTFLNDAFSKEEQKQILNTAVSADKNPEYDTDPGNVTNDKVFLLSITEAEKYFSSDSARRCKPTEYAAAKGAYTHADSENCWWWLRSPGDFQNNVAFVDYSGFVYHYGDFVNSGVNTVRPALWLGITGSTVEDTTEPVTEPPTTTKKAEAAPVSPVSSAPAYSKQIIHFNTANQNMTLYTLSGTSWQKDMENIYFTYGKGGKTSSISEGDDKSPLGVYDVGFYIGLNRANTDLPFRAVHTDSVWVCDPDSEYYNVFTDESNIDSSVDYEQVYDLYYADGSFNYQLYFEQNGDGLTPGSASYGAGSFLTVCGKNKELKPTYGCIDISGANMERLLSFLDADLNPVVVIE